MQLSYRDTWAEISLEAIKHNVTQYKRFIGTNVQLMAVVKADGYGHGAVEVAWGAIESGANYLAVAILDEALELREAGITAPILVLGYTPNRSIKAAINADIELTVFSRETLSEIIHQATTLDKMVSIHLKVDTGMSRIGLQTAEEVLQLALTAQKCRHVFVKGIFTHFAHADSADSTYTYKQFERFNNIISFLENRQLYVPLKHCCNTAATMNYPEMHLDMVRVGIGLYGLYPDSALKSHQIKLKQAMTLNTTVAALKKIPLKQPISYGCTKLASEGSMLATLPIGYADGLSRSLSNKGVFLLKGKRVLVAGRVCMDQTMIEVPESVKCTEGDIVTIFGYHEEVFQSVDEIAILIGTINYEVVCLIGKRVPRIYLETCNLKSINICNGKLIKTASLRV
ncbi:alanine racemase [Bacillus sp. DNRA2]|uniref:alanine racemase n=1 Tax=Bacillus sp. DNRA2 TaxID=2723053 RepID=UPI001B7D1902|nr:alanine racemase [Bacillus sp. DNRA2]